MASGTKKNATVNTTSRSPKNSSSVPANTAKTHATKITAMNIPAKEQVKYTIV